MKVWFRIAWHVLTEIGGKTLLENINADRMFVIRGIRQMLVEQLMAAADLGKCITRRLTYGFLRYLAYSLKPLVVTRIIDDPSKLLDTNVLDPLLARRRKHVLLRYHTRGADAL